MPSRRPRALHASTLTDLGRVLLDDTEAFRPGYDGQEASYMLKALTALAAIAIAPEKLFHMEPRQEG